MNEKCLGCGVKMQTSDVSEIGYVSDKNKEICDRCFRIKHYNEYKKVTKTNEEFSYVLHEIDKTDDLVLFVVDVFNIPKNIEEIRSKIGNNVILVLTKRDIFPSSLNDNKLLNFFNDDYLEKIIISSEKNLRFDELLNLIYKYKVSKNVYVVGFTNAGKSTMINKLIYNYSNNDFEITTSPLTSTTIDNIKIIINENLILHDTPGTLEEGDAVDILENKLIKKIVPKKTIKPRTFQIKSDQFINVENVVVIEVLESCNLTFYISNALNLKRYYKNKEEAYDYVHEINFKKGKDIVIKGVGFVKASKSGKVRIHTNYAIDVYTRTSLI